MNKQIAPELTLHEKIMCCMGKLKAGSAARVLGVPYHTIYYHWSKAGHNFSQSVSIYDRWGRLR